MIVKQQNIEIKVRTANDFRGWEQRPLWDLIKPGNYYHSHFEEYAKFVKNYLAKYHDFPIELRWNYEGSLQGNYISLLPTGE